MSHATPALASRPGAPEASEWGGGLLDLDAYLHRIGYSGPLEPTAATLRELHVAHLKHIPFENLDALLGGGVSLDPAVLQDKLVRQCRGGYCLEHNLLFALVLQRLGFPVTRLLARARDDGQMLLPRGHATLLVDTEQGTYLADVGFGGEGPLEPLPLRAGERAQQGGWRFQLERRGPDWVLRAGTVVLYSFTTGSYRRPDFESANYFVSTHPSSPFAREVIVQRVSPQARYSLRGLDLVITLPTRRRARQRVAPSDLGRVLASTFDLRLDAGQADRLAELAASSPRAGRI